MILDKRPYTFDRVVRLALSAAVIFGMVWLLGYLADVLIPFAVAFLLAYLINPLVNLLQKHIVKNRLGAVLLSLFLVFCALTGLAWLVIPMIVTQAENLLALLSKLVASKEFAERGSELLPSDIWKYVRETLARDDVKAYLSSERFFETLQSGVDKILPIGKGIFSGLASLVFSIIGLAIIMLYLVFLLLDYQKVRQDWRALVPHNYRETVFEFVYEFDRAMNRYFRAQATVASIVGILFAVGFQIIGLPMAILLGLFIGLLNMVPYLQIIGFIPAAVLAVIHSLDSGQNFLLIMGQVIVVFAVVQTIQDAVLTPKIMGDVTGLSPAIILLSLSVWGKLLGMLGLLIALPMTCLLLAYYKRLLISDENKALTDGSENTGSST